MGRIEEIIESKQCPGIGRGYRPGYKRGLALYPDDPTAFCSSKYDHIERIKRQGKVIVKN